jgi:hypothetical protein
VGGGRVWVYGANGGREGAKGVLAVVYVRQQGTQGHGLRGSRMIPLVGLQRREVHYAQGGWIIDQYKLTVDR